MTMNSIQQKEQEIRDLKFQDAQERYNEYIGKSYYSELGLGTVFIIKEINHSFERDVYIIYLVTDRVDIEDGITTQNLRIDTHNAFDIRKNTLYFVGMECVEIDDYTKAKILHYFDKVEHKKKEFYSFRKVCTNEIKKILNNK